MLPHLVIILANTLEHITAHPNESFGSVYISFIKYAIKFIFLMH